LLTIGIFTIQKTQSIFLQAAAAILAEVGIGRAEIFFQFGQIKRAASPAADAVQFQMQLPMPSEINNCQAISITSASSAGHYPNGFIAELMELAEASGLGPFITETGSDVVKLDRRRQIGQSMFEVGPANRRCTLRFKSQLIATRSLKTYISFCTISVPSPTPRIKRPASSKTGVSMRR